MSFKSIAEHSNRLTRANGTLTLPEGVTGKAYTVYRDGKPVQSAVVFSDGSELSISTSGQTFHSDVDEWPREAIAKPGAGD